MKGSLIQNQSAVLSENGELSMQDRPLSTPGPDEFAVKVDACPSDIPPAFKEKIYYSPFITGHEFAGETVGANTDLIGGPFMACP